MPRHRKTSLLIASFAFCVSIAGCPAVQARPTTFHHATFGVAPAGKHLTALVGDRESGLGFYPLPRRYRGIERTDHRGDAIRYAIASEPGYAYYYGIGGENGASVSHHHALFNPVDGYGTPFFAGYYGSARDDADDNAPLGTPYAN